VNSDRQENAQSALIIGECTFDTILVSNEGIVIQIDLDFQK
jgi:hypothetical protein